MYLVYIIIYNNLSYVGMTNNFLNRLQQHNGILTGGAKYTKKGSNWTPICIIDGFANKSEAMQCEWKIKSRKSKLSKLYNGIKGRIEYLNLLLNDDKWTSKSPLIIDQRLHIYIVDKYKYLLTNYTQKGIILRELYFE